MTRLHALPFLLVSFGIFLPASRAAERTVRETFSVQPGCLLSIDTYRGGIVVEESEGTEVRVTVHLESSLASERDANQAIDALKLELKAEGNHVSVRARNPSETRLRFVWSDDEPVDISFQVSVPSRCSVSLATGNGGIVVGTLTGDMSARTGTGTIFFRRIDGSVQAASGGGDVVVSRCSGNLSLVTRRGNIRAGTVRGRAELKTANGDIDILSAGGGLVASAEAGDVVAGFPRGLTEGATITASAGNILAKLDPALDCAVKAASVWGRVETALPFVTEAGGVSKSKFSGRLNKGGPLLTFRANGGHVKIEKNDELTE